MMDRHDSGSDNGDQNSLQSKTSNSDSLQNLINHSVNELRSGILQANTTSVLNTLEEHRQKLSPISFRGIILLLVQELNEPTWAADIEEKTIPAAFSKHSVCPPKQRRITKIHIHRCVLVVFYYIASVMNKYSIADTDPIWTEILDNSITQNIAFYQFLYKNKITPSNAICTTFAEKLRTFYARQTASDKIKLILLGFVCERSSSNLRRTSFYVKIKDYEKIFSQLQQKQRGMSQKNTQLQQLVSAMTTPEELSLFLSYFSDYDLNTSEPISSWNVLDRIINMKPYFYPVRENDPSMNQGVDFLTRDRLIRPRNANRSKLGSDPNEITKYRTMRILNLFRSVILQGAQLSCPCYSGRIPRMNDKETFLFTSIGIYALIGLRMDDIHPSKSPRERDQSFVVKILELIGKFEGEFVEFILHYLSASYSIIHEQTFIDEQRRNENLERQKVNDILFQRPLTLKEWCRLKIKTSCSLKQIEKLGLSNSLTNYCSFGLLASNYASKCIDEVTSHQGNIFPLKKTGVRNVADSEADIDHNDGGGNMDEDSSDDANDHDVTASVDRYDQNDGWDQNNGWAQDDFEEKEDSPAHESLLRIPLSKT